jgi:hydroxypyruvate isomerase
VFYSEKEIMSSFKQCTTWWPLSKALEADGAMERVKALGFEGVEMPPRDKFDFLRDNGLTIVTIGGHGTLTDGLNKRENHARIADELNEKFELAREYGIPNLIVFSGNRNGLSDEEGAEITAEGLKSVAPAAEKAGVTLILELLNSKVDHPDYQCDHTIWGAKVIQAVNSPRVKLLYDIYHMQIMEGDLIRNIRDNIQHIAHFHTAGNPGRKDLDDEQEIYYPAVAKAIHDTGYKGWLGHEFGPKGDAFAALKQAYAACDVE